MRRYQFAAVGLLAVSPLLAAYVGASIGGGILHSMRLNRMRLEETQAMLARTGARKEDFTVAAIDGVQLRGWKVRAPAPNGDWVFLYHGVSDNRTGDIGHAEFLLRHGYSLVMMDARAHGESGGDMATYGWKERDSTIPCRHSRRIYKAATGPKEFWILRGAGHAAALGAVPAEYETRVVSFFGKYPANPSSSPR